MYSTTVLLLTLGLFATMAVARPGRRPWSGDHNHHHEDSDNEMTGEHGAHKWSTFRVPSSIRIPRVLAEKLGRPWVTFTSKKIFDGKYLLISPALMFRLKDSHNETDPDRSTTPSSSTTEESIVDETTPSTIDEESTTAKPEDSGEEETMTARPRFFRKRLFEDEDEQLLFLDSK
ncbi:unnamed protein product [Adineta ricciae]|uniref:Uncharacterized protein n=1 Tax=Adineta ricciae TaxID=249248 RepID=A0A813UGY6_ADIRI|nr:unnamed protein product [Adineta ricciae]